MSQSDMFDLDKRWPDLFDRLDPAQRRSVIQTLARVPGLKVVGQIVKRSKI